LLELRRVRIHSRWKRELDPAVHASQVGEVRHPVLAYALRELGQLPVHVGPTRATRRRRPRVRGRASPAACSNKRQREDRRSSGRVGSSPEPFTVHLNDLRSLAFRVRRSLYEGAGNTSPTGAVTPVLPVASDTRDGGTHWWLHEFPVRASSRPGPAR